VDGVDTREGGGGVGGSNMDGVDTCGWEAGRSVDGVNSCGGEATRVGGPCGGV
jgi:hypothetical protein